jgi:hypothetical protein
MSAMAVCQPAPADANTLFLNCANKIGARLTVTIYFETQVVDVLGDYGLHWRAANAQISDNRIYWETQFETRSRSGTDTWILDRYSGTLTTYHPGANPENNSFSAYKCERGKPPQRKF